MNTYSFTLAFSLVIAGGLLTGSFAVPMKYLGRWRWENIWAAYSLFGLVLIPCGVIWGTVPNLWQLYAQVPMARTLSILALGYLWGVGSATFGLGIDRLGMGIGFSLIMGVATLLGTLLPFLTETVHLRPLPFALGLVLLLTGVSICGFAGRRRERDSPSLPGRKEGGYATGIVLCVVSGVFSSFFNVGMVAGRPVQELAASSGAPGWAAGNTVWPVLLFGGFLSVLTYCGYLMWKNASVGRYRTGGWREWGGTFLMGAFWIGGVMMYGAGAFFMGDLGPFLGWPVFTSLIIISAYLLGQLTGEWRGVRKSAVRWMNTGIAVIVVSLFLIAASKSAPGNQGWRRGEPPETLRSALLTAPKRNGAGRVVSRLLRPQRLLETGTFTRRPWSQRPPKPL